MARARLLKPSFFTNEALSSLPSSARLLFCGLWTIGDREGRLEDRPPRIKVELLPYDRVNIDGLLQKLHDAGFIVRYEAGGNRYIQIVNFAKHQHLHPNEAASMIPAQDSSGNGASTSVKGESARARNTSSNTSSSSDPSDRAPPPPVCRDAFFRSESTGGQVAAVIDLWREPLSERQRKHLGGLLKRSGHGQRVWDAAVASTAKADPVQFMERILSDGSQGARAKDDHGGKDVRGPAEDPASPFSGMGRQAGSSGEET